MRALPARRLLALLLVVAAANVAIFLFEATLLSPVRVPTGSMEPTLQLGDRVLVDRTTGFDELRRGDLVVFRVRRDAGQGRRFDGDSDRPQASDNFRGGGDTQLLVKRVVALPRETVEARSQLVAINGTLRLDEPYAEWGNDDSSFSEISIRDDEVWVMGDNRERSRDSRNFGPVPRDAVVGVVALRIWPFDRWGDVR